MIKQSNTNHRRSGFTLIENIIAFTILTITILAASNLLSNSIRQAEQNTLRLQAYLLAEQGLESARNIRDSQWVQNIDFSETKTKLWGGNNFYPKNPLQEVAINPIYNSLNSVNGSSFEILDSSQAQLYIDKTQGYSRYSHTPNGDKSPFKRTIKLEKEFPALKELAEINTAQQNNFDIQQTLEDNILLVTSTVEYEFRGQTKQLSLQTILSDWKEGPL